jgi:hypothetical protein
MTIYIYILEQWISEINLNYIQIYKKPRVGLEYKANIISLKYDLFAPWYIIRNNSTKIRINNKIRTNLEQPELPHIIPEATKSSRSASILSNLGYPIISPYSQRQLKKQMK